MIYNDKCLILLKRLIFISIFFVIITAITSSIYCFTKSLIVAGIAILIGGLFLAVIVYVLGMCLVSYLFDIKLIRNKMYNLNNEKLCDELYNNIDTKLSNEHK